MTNGLQPTGFIAPTTADLVAQLNAAVLSKVDAGLNLAPDQPVGQIIGIFAEKLAEVWELMSTVYNQLNPDAAEQILLDNICAISGVRRRSATYSKVSATLNINGSTTVPAGSVVTVVNQPANRWALQANVHNAGGSAADFTGEFWSEEPGPFAANAGTLTQIATPVIGWNSVFNTADGVQGIPEDSDAVLRQRRQDELSASGSGTIDALRSDVLAVAGVLQAFVFENTSFVADFLGQPGKSVRAIIWDGPGHNADDDAVAQAIWNDKPSGIQAYGASDSGTATDSLGILHVIPFDRAAEIPIYFSVTTTPSTLTPEQTAAVKASIKAKADSVLNLGVDVIALLFRAAALVSGISDVPALLLGVAPSPTLPNNIAISDLQIATVSTTNILVNGI